MKKILLVMAVAAMVIGISFPTMAKAGEVSRFEPVILTDHNSPPKGQRTVRTVVAIVAGFNVCYWGEEGRTFEKMAAIQRWEHPNGEDTVYNLFMPDKKTALACIKERGKLAVELSNWKVQLDKETPEPASVGSQVWIDLHLQNFLATLNPS